MSRRRLTADWLIKAGFWTQLVLLGLVDWGTLYAFKTADSVPWYHYVGFSLVNVFAIWLTWVTWRWLRDQKTGPLDRARARKQAELRGKS